MAIGPPRFSRFLPRRVKKKTSYRGDFRVFIFCRVRTPFYTRLARVRGEPTGERARARDISLTTAGDRFARVTKYKKKKAIILCR